MRRLGLALAIPAFLILLVASSGFALAQEWENQEKITLRPGESTVVKFNNPTDNSITLVIENLYMPFEPLQIVVNPSVIFPESLGKNVIITFVDIPFDVRQGIPPYTYSVLINGRIIYLDLSEGSALENSDNIIILLDDLDERVGDLEETPDPSPRLESLEEWTDNFLARLKALETAPAEHWAGAIENLRLWALAELENIRNTPHENSPAENSGNLENRLRTEFDGKLAQIKRDLIAKTKSDEETNMIYAAVVAAIVAMVVIAVAGKFGMIKKTFGTHTVSKTGPASEVTDDQIAMLENTIGAMRDRGEPANAIKKKELELKFLKDSQELEKPEEEKPVEKKPEVE